MAFKNPLKLYLKARRVSNSSSLPQLDSPEAALESPLAGKKSQSELPDEPFRDTHSSKMALTELSESVAQPPATLMASAG